MDKMPLVSVVMITYGHEKFIEEAINSILIQECDFKIELIIANDASPDKTDDIIQDILKSHKQASIINYIKHEQNIGMIPNFIFALQQSKSKYIALCEGDDYWIDPLKLQKQVNFLEENPDFSLCFHRVKILRGDNLFDDSYIESRYNSIKKRPVKVEDLIEQGNFIHTTSAVFKNSTNKLPFEFNYSSVGDYFLHIIISQKGYIKRLDSVMGVYREGVGIYSTLSSESMLKKIIIYQTCILSFLNDDSLKKILLKKTLKNIENVGVINMDKDYLSRTLSFKSLLKIMLLKIKKRLIK